MEIIETGALRRVDAERTEDVAAVQLFQGIYGVGMDGCGFSLDLPSSSPSSHKGNRLRMLGILLAAARLKTSRRERVALNWLRRRC